MNKQIILLLFLSIYVTSLSAYIDTDLDGVSDAKDRCPNTLITDLVDMNGCSIKSLKNPHHFDIITGITYDTIEKNATTNTTNYNIQLDYYYQDFSLQLVSTYQDTTDSINDIYLSGFYNFTPYTNLQLRVGLGAVIPLQNVDTTQNNTDFIASLNLSYSIKKYNLFTGYNYTNVNDTNENVDFQDITSFNIGAGVYIQKDFYASLSYTNSKTIIKGSDNLENISLYLFHSINKNFFVTLNYDHYTSERINSIALKVGYYF